VPVNGLAWATAVKIADGFLENNGLGSQLLFSSVVARPGRMKSALKID
jgi:hypothetical protein